RLAGPSRAAGRALSRGPARRPAAVERPGWRYRDVGARSAFRDQHASRERVIVPERAPTFAPGASEGWAHQDSNLERAGYEPAALTIELWAQDSLQSPVVSRQSYPTGD